MLWKQTLIQLTFLTSILWGVPDSVQNQNQRFCTTATYVILPSTTYKASAVDNFALSVLLTNFCSWKIVLRNLLAQKTLHKKSPHALYHVNIVENYWVCANQPTLKDALCILDKINNCLLNKEATFCLSGSLKSRITKQSILHLRYLR